MWWLWVKWNKDIIYICCLLKMVKTSSVTAEQQSFHSHFAKEPPYRPMIYQWYHCFGVTGWLCPMKHSECLSVSCDKVEETPKAYQWSPWQSFQWGSCELQTLTSLWHVLWNHFCMCLHKLQLVHSLTNNDEVTRHAVINRLIANSRMMTCLSRGNFQWWINFLFTCQGKQT